MLLSARLLEDVCSENKFGYTQTLQWTQGDRPTIYFQAVDKAVEPTLNPPGRRWIPPAPDAQPGHSLIEGLSGTPQLLGGSLATDDYWYSVIAKVDGAWTLPVEVDDAVSVVGPTGSVDLTWTAASGATEYKVFRGTSSGGENILVYQGDLLLATDDGSSTTEEYPDLGTFQAMSVTFTDIDSSVTTWAQATNPFSLDTSIFSCDIFGNLDADHIDAFAGTYGLKLAWETGFKATVANVTQAAGTVIIDQEVPSTLPSAGFIWVGGVRYAYSSYNAGTKSFVLDLTVGPQLSGAPVGGTVVWVPTATTWGYLGLAANITLRESEV
jgi:hypothetical protein